MHADGLHSVTRVSLCLRMRNPERSRKPSRPVGIGLSIEHSPVTEIGRRLPDHGNNVCLALLLLELDPLRNALRSNVQHSALRLVCLDKEPPLLGWASTSLTSACLRAFQGANIGPATAPMPLAIFFSSISRVGTFRITYTFVSMLPFLPLAPNRRE